MYFDRKGLRFGKHQTRYAPNPNALRYAHTPTKSAHKRTRCVITSVRKVKNDSVTQFVAAGGVGILNPVRQCKLVGWRVFTNTTSRRSRLSGVIFVNQVVWAKY